MLKTTQNQKNLFNLIKLFSFFGILYIIYLQMSGLSSEAWIEFNLKNPAMFIFGLVLVVPNLWLAYLKWTATLKIIVPDTELRLKHQSFFAGLITGMLTPNMAGNFIGRLYYFDRQHRSSIILFTLLSNYTQFLASITFGFVSILLVGNLYYTEMNGPILLIVIFGVLALIFLFYFLVEKLALRIRPKSYFLKFKEELERNRLFRFRILGLGLLRFLIFTTQFSLILAAFGEQINANTIFFIWQVYLLTMIIPSLFLGKIGVRESVALFVLAGLGMNEYSILFASLIIWFINSLSPALLGLIICKNDVRHV